ncbi:hypothetical protein VDG1235_4012 [Verrucomicrobiia bacterium DG1235]|nr:hypothetical protein VDG1235_4012 [Verrucomicrobiae bacterium DG1235]
MSENKPNLKHPAAWIHGLIHFVLITIVLGWVAGLALGFLHMMIDTRRPFLWWRKVFRMTSAGETATHVAIWTDQVLHVLCLAMWIQFVAPLNLGL